jgi:carboxyl-terminal processing protease
MARIRPALPRISRLFAALLLASATAPAIAAPPADETADAAPDEPALSLDELRTFADVFNAVRNYYVEDVDEAALIDAALAGMIASLDPYSDYLGADALQAFEDGSQGRQAGIGARLEADERRRLVFEDVYPDGPAWRAGIRSGDLLLAVDGVKVRGRPLRDSLAALGGAPATTVNLRVRTGQDTARKLSLERAWVPVPSVHGRLLEGDVALLRVERFHVRTDVEFRDRLDELARAADGGLRGIVIDLRDNPGGVIQSAAKIADGFLADGLVVSTQGRYPASHLEYRALPDPWAPNLPVAILVNGGSASASEILAGALQDRGRASIVGARTWGKGTVQSVLKLRNGSALKLSTARYATPSGRSFEGVGIEPDHVVEAPAGGGEGMAGGPPGATTGRDGDLPDDPVLAAALDLLNSASSDPVVSGERE